VRVTDFGRFALSTCVPAAMLAGCGGSQQPIGAPGVMSQRPAIATQALNGESAARRAKGADLLYSSTIDDTVLIFAYPQGKLLETLAGFQIPMGLCSDKEGNVFVVDLGAEDIVEFAHGGNKPIATLDDSGNDPNACYVDPTTDNLAVAGGGLHTGGNVAVFAGAQGKPVVYTAPPLSLLAWCTYDGSGNLFAEGYATGSATPPGAIVELPSGGKQFTRLSLNVQIGGGGDVQWDGQYLAVSSPRGAGPGMHGPATIYQFRISGSSATMVNTIELSTGKGNKNPGGVEFWVQDGYLVAPKNHTGGIGRWRYPGGGLPVKTHPTHGYQIGVTISKGPKS
jgi:hypothetical protein